MDYIVIGTAVSNMDPNITNHPTDTPQLPLSATAIASPHITLRSPVHQSPSQSSKLQLFTTLSPNAVAYICAIFDNCTFYDTLNYQLINTPHHPPLLGPRHDHNDTYDAPSLDSSLSINSLSVNHILDDNYAAYIHPFPTRDHTATHTAATPNISENTIYIADTVTNLLTNQPHNQTSVSIMITTDTNTPTHPTSLLTTTTTHLKTPTTTVTIHAPTAIRTHLTTMTTSKITTRTMGTTIKNVPNHQLIFDSIYCFYTSLVLCTINILSCFAYNNAFFYSILDSSLNILRT